MQKNRKSLFARSSPLFFDFFVVAETSQRGILV